MQPLSFALLMALIAVSASARAADQPVIGVAPVTMSQDRYTFDSAEQHGFVVTVLAKGLQRSFAMAFLPDGDLLVSERGGQLRVIHDATGATPQLDPQPVAGVPALAVPYRNGGLHDLALHPDFARNHWLYFTYNKGEPEVAVTAGQRPRSAVSLMRGRYADGELTDVEELFVAPFGGTSGSRLVFAGDGSIFLSTGAPFADDAQKLDNVYGKVLHLKDDGTMAAGNPFAGRSDALPSIYSYGHRDQLGLAIHPATGTLLAAEHGPNGGDEVNVILPGRNYGWPVYSFGRNYDGKRLSALPVVDGIEQPLVVWSPSIAPSGLLVYTGERFPAWKGNLFVGSARRGEIDRTGGLERVVLNENLEDIRRETLLTELHQRVRDVRQGPDGLLYVLTDGDEFAVLRLAPD